MKKSWVALPQSSSRISHLSPVALAKILIICSLNQFLFKQVVLKLNLVSDFLPSGDNLNFLYCCYIQKSQTAVIILKEVAGP